MKLENSIALVTGANRGIGAEFVRQLQARGAAKIYAAVRDVAAFANGDVEVVALDITDPTQVAAAARQAGDVQLLINNAGIATGETLLDGDLGNIRRELETNLFGPLLLARAFAPILAANSGGAILNVLSAASWFSAPGATTYGLSKAAAWSLTDGLRVELSSQDTHVLGLHMAAVDTDMSTNLEVDKIDPAIVVSAALDGIEAGATEVLADDITAFVKASLGQDPAERYGAFLVAQA